MTLPGSFFSISMFAIFLLLTLFLATLYLAKGMKESTYNKDERHAVIGDVRSDLEKQISALTERLMMTEEHWREMYNLVVTGQQAADGQEAEAMLSSFITGMGVTRNQAQLDPQLAFVLTPYNQSQSETFATIHAVCERAGLRCTRGDEEYQEQANILKNIVCNIVRARIVVANVNGRNPNVMYELGIAQAIGKPTILVAKSLSRTPFDIRFTRILLYRDQQDLEHQLTNELQQALRVHRVPGG